MMPRTARAMLGGRVSRDAREHRRPRRPSSGNGTTTMTTITGARIGESRPESDAAARDVPSLSPKVAEAERCDASGDHGRAIDLLAAACREDDVDALTRLGKRLLVGANAPHRPADAVVLLTRAADLGGAEAAAQYA